MGAKDKIKKDLFSAMDSITNEEFDALSSENQTVRLRLVAKRLADFNYCLILKNYILNPDKLIGILETYVHLNETHRVNYLAWMLNRYYNGVLQDKFNESIEEENYELSAKLKPLINIVKMPTVKE